jgi:hypothetical protein
MATKPRPPSPPPRPQPPPPPAPPPHPEEDDPAARAPRHYRLEAETGRLGAEMGQHGGVQ